MSVRTIGEFNHDFAHQIDEDPEEFVRLLGAFLRTGDGDYAGQLERFGLRLALSAHHSTDRMAVVGGLQYPF